MRTENTYEQMRETLNGSADVIIREIIKGNDVEIRKAPGGGIKVLIVRKQLLDDVKKAG